MKSFKLTSLALLAFASSPVMAEKEVEDVDPSDMTRAYTQLHVGANNQGSVKILGSLSYNYESGAAGMGSLEATIDKEGDYSDSRFQYFHVYGTGSEFMPRVAGSIDIIDNSTFTTANLGLANAMTTGIDGFTIYSRLGAVVGQYSDDFAELSGINDQGVTGGMAGVYFTYAHQSGFFISAFPEYTSVTGEADLTNLKTTLTFGAPISEQKDKWLQFRFEDIQNEITGSGFEDQKLDERIFWSHFKIYF